MKKYVETTHKIFNGTITKELHRGKYRIISIRRLFTFFIILLSLQQFAFAQDLWNDKSMVDSLKAGIHATYNFEFNKAERICGEVNAKYPEHAAVLMFDALILSWKYYPIQHGTVLGNKFESLLLKSLEASDKQLKERPDHQLSKFFAMMPRLMLVQYFADNGLAMKTAPHLSTVYRSIVNGFDLIQTTPEFYFTTGLYNYYRESYADANPLYRPIVYFFPDGNKEIGLKYLYECWQKSDFIGPEALLFLSYIYINFETDYDEGCKYTVELTQQYPNNPLFAEHYIQLLLLDKQYEKAQIYVSQILENKNYSNYFKVTASVYDAIIEEHQNKNIKESEKTYHSAIQAMNLYGNFAKRYWAYAYFGLSRISKVKGLMDESKQYKSKAKKFAQYPNVNFD